MRLPVFLEKVDAYTGRMSRKQLQGLVHEIARTGPEDERERFLSLVSSYAAGNAFRNDEEENKTLEDEIAALLSALEDLEEDERTLTSTYDEEYDDWDYSDSDEFIFGDPDGILDDIRRAINLVHICMDRELYRQGFALAECLSCLSISVTGDFSDYEDGEMDLETLYTYDLLDDDAYELFKKEAVYLCYMAGQAQERADRILQMIENLHDDLFRLEDMMQMGKGDLPDFDAFLSDWIRLLSASQGRRHEAMLQEALSLLQDEESVLKTAEENIKAHPALLEKVLQDRLDRAPSDSDRQFLEGGLCALDQLPVSSVARSRIALLTASYALRLGDKAGSERCLLEAFRSQTTVLNYLRLRFLTEDWEKYRTQTREIFTEMYLAAGDIKNRCHMYHPEGENVLDGRDCCCIFFFQQDFEKMLDTGMQTKKALGWSSTFMKEGIALMLLLLDQGDGQGMGMKNMLSRAMDACGFDAGEFFKGTALEIRRPAEEDKISFAEEIVHVREDGPHSKEVFADLFRSWKKEVRISESDTALWIERIDRWIERRVEGIMNANRRNYYAECASFIAAFGEMLESRGTTGAKAQIMERYRAAYPRRRAFHDDLYTYGMRRKKR